MPDIVGNVDQVWGDTYVNDIQARFILYGRTLAVLLPASRGNDDIADALALPSGTTGVWGSGVGYGVQASEPWGDVYAASAWFTFVAPATATIALDIPGSFHQSFYWDTGPGNLNNPALGELDYDTFRGLLAVYDSFDGTDFATLNQLVSTYGQSTMAVTVDVTAGTRYWVQILGVPGSDGDGNPAEPGGYYHLTYPDPAPLLTHPDLVRGSTGVTVSTDTTGPQRADLALVAGSTVVSVTGALDVGVLLDPVRCGTSVYFVAPPPPPPPLGPAAVDQVNGTTVVNDMRTNLLAFGLDTVLGVTRVNFRGERAYEIDAVLGSTDVEMATAVIGVKLIVPDAVLASTTVNLTYAPDLSENPPIDMAFNAVAEMLLIPPAAYHTYEDRAMSLVSMDMATPLIVNGLPTVPRYWPSFSSQAHAIKGSRHIHAEDPAPIWNPRTGGWAVPPPPSAPKWHGRWVVDDLPDPPSGGFYWLGDPSYADGTGHYRGARTRWGPHASSPGAPSWRSFFPYKPSVRAFDAYLPDGGVVHHPRGLHFNTQFVEHMWMDFGGSRRQPFTWVIAAMVAGYPTHGYVHHILDSGRNPDAVRFPRLSASAVYDNHTIHDGLAYRNMITYGSSGQRLGSGTASSGSSVVRARTHTNVRPKMFFGVFNGAHSLVGAWGPGDRETGRGRIPNGAAQSHRFYVLGRENGHIGHSHASHLLMFEIRFWNSALTADQLEDQYKQLSSTYQYDRYRSLR